MTKQILGLAVAAALLSGCGGGSGSTSGNPTAASAPVQFGEARGARLNLDSFSASVKTDTLTVTKPAPDFWLKARSADDNEMMVRYGIDRDNYSGRTNHVVPLTNRSFRGVAGRTGSVSYVDPDAGLASSFEERQLEAGVDTRTMTVFDVTNDVITHGLIFTEDSGARGDFHEAHAYGGGAAASNVPSVNTASYSGVFLGHISEVGVAPNSDVIEMDASMEINFGANTFTGSIGTGGTEVISMSGTRFTSTGTGTGGRQLGGTARVETGALGLAVGRSGPIDGRIFGDGATGAAGAISIEDGTGTNRKVLVGSFGVNQ